ncbi:hypothetical protein SDC9_59120 [bioreactor metagenome]|uniref:Uncharacterized protein n=1 Tax=bioreactor metagenome TaxID=1076179 RepID=A0A644X9B1_9ZZZZ
MGRAVAVGGEVHHAGDVVLAELAGAGGLYVVRVALGADAAGGDKGNDRVLHVLHRRVGRNPVEDGHGILGDEGLSLELGGEHVHRPLGGELVVELVLPDAPLDVAFLGGSAELLALQELQDEGRHGGNGLFHACCAVRGFHDVEALLVHLHAGVFGVHSGHRGDAELLDHGFAHGAAGGAVAARVEGRPGNHCVGLVLLHHVKYFGGRLLHVGSEIGVSADNCGNYLGIRSKSGLQGHSRPDDSLPDFGSDVSLLFASDAGVKLVYIMNDPV